MRVFELLLIGAVVLLISIIAVNEGVHPDYVGLTVMSILLSLILLVKLRPDVLHKYLELREQHRKYNGKTILGEDN